MEKAVYRRNADEFTNNNLFLMLLESIVHSAKKTKVKILLATTTNAKIFDTIPHIYNFKESLVCLR